MEDGEEAHLHLEEEEEDSGEVTSSDTDESEEEVLQAQVAECAADVPFELLQQAKSEGHSKLPREKSKAAMKRLNKNRPMEISSKKPVGRYREVVQAPKRIARDPRFESLCGDFEESRFKRSYRFLYDENLPAEREELYKSLKKEKDPNIVAEKKKQLAWMERQLKSEVERRKHAERETEQKKNERELVKKGKTPYYVKKSDKRRAVLIEKYKELKAAGKLEAFLAKRRQKNAAKDHRYMPYRRPQQAT